MGNKQSSSKGGSKKVVNPSPTIDDATKRELQDKYGFDNVKIDQFAKTFIDAVGPDKQLTKETFKICCKQLEPLGVRIADTPFEDRLFSLLDKDGSGTIDVSEFLTGMAVIVKGSKEDKLWLTFKAYDINGDDKIDKQELIQIFKQAWLAGLCTLMSSNDVDEDGGDETAKDIEEFSSELAEKFAEKAFSHLDENNDGYLSFEEFKKFAQQDPKITTTLNGFQKEIRITLMSLSDLPGPASSSTS